MDAQDFRRLQEAYMDVVMNEGKKPLPMEKMKKKIGNIKSSMKSTIEKSANEVGMNPKRVKFPFSPDDREKYSKYEKRVSDISKNLKKEDYDLYDIILSHLLDEGYADTQEAAEAIMVNMSEDWRESICEGLGGAKNQGDYDEIERKRKEVRDEHLRKYKSGELPFQKQKKADQAQDFLKKYPKKKK
jgi:hypothetical protein